MSYSVGANASAATGTRNRVRSISPFSGMCVTCQEGCMGLCEVGKSAIRGREIIYPQPYGKATFAAEKDYPIDYSHLSILGSCVGAWGIPAESDVATFPNVDVGVRVGGGEEGEKISLRLPVIIAALGSTEVGRSNWEGLAVGAAIGGTILTVGENVCGMDPESVIRNGRIERSPEMERRVRTFQRWYDGTGIVAVQSNVEDTNLGVLEYAIEKLGVQAVELKWGQGAKDIGGEVKLSSIERALQLKERGYIVYPDPEDPGVQAAFERGTFKEFERHSRIGMVDEESFAERVRQLRSIGAKYVFLKTGAYRPADLARAVKYASDNRIDLLTVDGAGGGTGMSPWRMMNEWGIPTIYLESLLVRYLDRLSRQGRFIPDVAIAGGFALEDQVFKGLALGAPYVKVVSMARAPLTAVMVGKSVGEAIRSGKTPRELEEYGSTVDQVFSAAFRLKERYGKSFEEIPPSAIALYTYFDRIVAGLKQLMCGARKFSLQHISRDDLVSLTREAAELTGIPYVLEADESVADEILSVMPRNQVAGYAGSALSSGTR